MITQYFSDMKDYDAVMIECKDDTVNIDSMVCISPFDTRTGKWCCGLMIITDMKTALEQKLFKVSKDLNVEQFLGEYYDKRKDLH